MKHVTTPSHEVKADTSRGVMTSKLPVPSDII
jgi:hypothetical protein